MLAADGACVPSARIGPKALKGHAGKDYPPRLRRGAPERQAVRPYFGGGGMKISRLVAGSGLGFGLGAFLASFLPLSLLPMAASVPQTRATRQGR